MRTLLFAVLLAALSMSTRLDQAAGKDKEPLNGRPSETEKQSAERQGYLGVVVEPLHPSLFGHLNELLHGGEGVRIVDVADDSPADEAGLKHNDVLLRYDDQRIFTPEQLAKLVSADKPGHEVALSIIRSGKSKKVDVTLGERRQAPAPTARRAFRPRLNERRERAERETPDQWDTFDALTLSRIGEDRFEATIKYRNKAGKLVTHRFKGTREEIIDDIKDEDDLPAKERDHLLRALGVHGRPMPLDLPELWVLPDGRVILEVPETEGEEAEEPRQPAY